MDKGQVDSEDKCSYSPSSSNSAPISFLDWFGVRLALWLI
jgi:hypothetical protein